MAPLFLALLFVTSALAQDNNCAPTDLTIDQKLEINADANDFNGDNVTDGADVTHDLTDNYDTNGDGVVDESEWIARWTCAFGDTSYYARFTFNQIGNGEANMRVDAFTNAFATAIPRSQFIAMNRQRYATFAQMGCVNTDLTVDQKLALNLQSNNHDNNSVVDFSDVEYDLNNNYDTDDDGEVTRAEWVLRWCCAYGDTAAYARYVFNQISGGADTIETSSFNRPPFNTTGIPVDGFEANNRQRYETYAAQQQAPSVGK